MPHYATTTFRHFGLELAEGEELPVGHPVAAELLATRPDLFTTTPPKARAKRAARTPKEG